MARLAFEWDSPSWRRGFVYLQPVASSVNILLHEITVWFGVKCDNSLFFNTIQQALINMHMSYHSY
jgi:hypothetical protein